MCCVTHSRTTALAMRFGLNSDWNVRGLDGHRWLTWATLRRCTNSFKRRRSMGDTARSAPTRARNACHLSTATSARTLVLLTCAAGRLRGRGWFPSRHSSTKWPPFHCRHSSTKWPPFHCRHSSTISDTRRLRAWFPTASRHCITLPRRARRDRRERPAVPQTNQSIQARPSGAPRSPRRVRVGMRTRRGRKC